MYSLSSVCPVQPRRQTNIGSVAGILVGRTPPGLARHAPTGGRDLGFREDAFDTFWQRLDGKPQLLTLDLFRGTPLEQAMNERVALATDDNAISTLIKLEDRSTAGKLRAALPGIIVLDQKDFVDHFVGLTKGGLSHFALWTTAIVAAIVYVSLGSVELLLAVLLPLGFGLLWTFGLMGWLGLPIDMMNSVFVIFIIGIGEDYSVFLVTSKLDEWRGHPQRLAATSASVMISALTTIFGFAVLVFARHPVLFSMGTTVLIGMVFTFAATLDPDAVVHGFAAVQGPAARRAALVAPARHRLGRRASGRQPVVSLLRVAADAEIYFAAHGGRPVAPRHAVDGAGSGQGVAVRQTRIPKYHAPKLSRRRASSSAIINPRWMCMLVVSLPGDVRQTAKKRVFDTPMLGIGCKLLGHVLVEPNDPEATLRRCRKRLDEGASVHFYPEGTRSLDGFVERFHRGAFELAVELNQEILPIVLCDTNTAMPRDAYWFEPYHVTVSALPRVTPQNFDYSRGSLALMQHCEELVREGLQDRLNELNTPRVVRRKVARLYRYQGKFVEQFVYWKMKTDPVFELLDAVVPRSGRILDLGCGYGLATHWLACYTDSRTFLGVDYDEDKIRVAQRTAPEHPRKSFERHDLFNWEFPPCDVVLLLDVLHYWTPDKQQLILNKVRRALRPGGRLILRDAARAQNAGHRRVAFWERFATRIGHNKTEEGLHFQTLAELQAMMERAGFAGWEIRVGAGRDSNILLIGTGGPTRFSGAQTPGIPREAT